jgi:ribosomal protein S18 acetylase RimI-like enzyme
MSIDLNNLILLHKSDIEAATEMLTRAFQHDPLLEVAFTSKREKERLAYYLFQYDLGYCFRYGEVYTTSAHMEGIAAWLPPDYYPRTLWNLIRSVPLSVSFGIVRSGGARMKSVGEYIDSMHKRLAPFKHWYLCVLGVDPRFQGEGYAGKLLREMLARIDEEGLPCYVETMTDKNVRLYEHFDFKIVEKSVIPKTNLTNWALLREAKVH